MMQVVRRPLVAVLATLLAAGALAGCSKAQSSSKYIYDKPAAKGELAPPAKMETVRVGFLPMPDALPLWAAQKAEYWPKAGAYVELVPFTKEAEMRKALVDGKVDGILTDLVQAIAMKGAGVDLQVTAVALGQTPAEGPITIVSSNAKIQTPEALKNQPISVIKGTAEEYAAEQMLLAAGLKPEEIKFVEGDIEDDERTRSLMTRAIPLAVLPEKYALMAHKGGHKTILTDAKAKESLSQSVYVFRTERLTAKADAVTRFFRGYNWGVADVILDGAADAKLLQENAKLAEADARAYPLTKYPGAAVPTKAMVEAAAKWLLAKGLIKEAPAYESLVNGTVLPEIK